MHRITERLAVIPSEVSFFRRNPDDRVKLGRVLRLVRDVDDPMTTETGQAAMDARWASSVIAVLWARSRLAQPGAYGGSLAASSRAGG